VDFSKLLEVYPTAGFKNVKGFGADQVLTGPGVTGLKPTSDLAIAGIGTENTDWEVDGNGEYHGRLQVGLADRSADPREGTPDLVIMNNVREEYDNSSKLWYLYYPADLASDVRGRVELSRIDMPTGSLEMVLWFWFLGRSSGALPTLDATYLRIPEPSGTPVVPSGDTDIVGGGWDPSLTLDASEYALATTPAFDVASGETVFFTLGWDGTSGPSEGFGILRYGWRVTVK
jgi:hypothetical protein